ncbi:lonely Cys domain-containing protein (plasmid) [Streptomyces scopuliridis]|uniref:lonely Cys domain-containing protein n=1 Tax=Streptomyces scopuliridis TaxID=452529 RepID=UPI002DD88C3D|nr:lonely Cys domain-containing protein [Streptomyces scopuliridis]WSB39259.1 lonely Cys domain-containing protein [Streptomyces scopuliridis]
MAPLVPAAPGAAEGFGPASGLEAELHRYRVVLPRGAEVEEFGDIVELPGLLTITLDKAGGVPVPEIVTKPARGLVRGPADGRAERSEVQAGVNEVMDRLRDARPGTRIGQIFPESAGYVVHPLAEDLPVRINEAGYATLVHHTATAPTSRLVAFIEHVRDRMRRESPPVRIAHADAGAGLAFGAWARQDFARWLSQYPSWADAANPWDGDELEGVIALGYTQVAATVRGTTLDGTIRPKDYAAVASRDSLAALRNSLGEGPRAYLEHRARSIAARFAETVVRGGGVLDLPLTMSRGPLRATVGQYLDNLLLHRPERFVSQYEALGIRTDFRTLDANPDHRGRALIVPAVVRLEARSYAAMEQTPQTIERDSDTLAVLSLNLYNEARLDRGLPPVGRPLAPAQPDFLFAPPATTAPSERPADSTVPAGPAPAPAPSPTPLPPALVEKAAGLVAMDADARARELASLPRRDRELLAADRAFVEQLRAGLSVEDFTAVAARLLVVVPDGVEQPEAAREEAEALVADMLADPQIAVALLTGGRRLVVVPRNRPMTSLEEFARLRGRHHPGGGWSADAARGLYYRRRLAGVGEENLLGETTDLPGDVYDDGYSVARQWAHAIESVLSAEDRQLIVDVFEAKVAAVPAAQWPDGPGPNHSSSSAHEYFAQLSNAYVGANTGEDSDSGRGPRNNGSDWVEQHDPALLPLLRRLYGSGRPSNLGSGDVYDDGYSVARQWAHAIESVLSAEDRQLIRGVFEAKAAAVPPVQWPDGPGPNHSSSDAHEYFAQLSNAYVGANTGEDSDSGRGPRNNGSDWVEQHHPALLPLLRRLYGSGRPSNLGSDDVYDDGYSVARHEWAHAIESVLSAEDRQLIRGVFEAKAAADPPAQWPDGPGPNHSSSNAHEYFAQLSNAYLGANTGKDSNSWRSPRNNGSDWVEQHHPALLPLLRRLYGPGRPSNLGSRDNPYILTGFRQLWDRAEGELTGHDSTPTSYDNVIPTQTRGVEVSDTVQQSGSDVHTEPEMLPAPPPPHGDRRVVAALRQMFGSDIERRSDYAALYDAFRVLESAHAADYRAAGQSLVLDDVARRVLRLTSNEAILPDHFRTLLQTVHSAARRDWAGSMGALAVYPVVRNTGALSHHTELRGPLDQYTGRNFTGRGGLVIDVSTVFMSMEDATGVPAPWRPRPHVVVAELDEASGNIVMDDGIGHRALLRDDEFAALVGHDPIRPPHAEVLLLVVAPSGAADTLPRLVADHAHTRVWATYGLFTLTSSGTGLRQIRLSESVHEPGNREPVGIFFPSDPGLGARDAVLLGSDGAEFLESDVHSYPLVTVDGQRLTGRVFLNADDTAQLEWGLRELSSVRYYTDRDEGVPGTHLRGRESGLLALPRELTNSYIAVWHGQHGRVVVPRRSTGRNQPVHPSQNARMLRRRPSLRRMPADHPVWIVGCETLWQREGRDPVEFPNGGEVYATEMQRTVYGTDAQVTPEGSWGEWPARLVKFDDPDRPAYRFQKFERAPSSDALRELADLAGLPGDVARRTTRVMRWVRAMRLVFGDIDTDLSRQIEFRSLIRDFGALEMRRLEMSDPGFDSGPLTWHTLTQIGTEFARQMGYDPTMTPGLLHALLRAARERTLRLSVPVSQAAQLTTSNYGGDEWVNRPSGSGRRWLRADIVDDETAPSGRGESSESADVLMAPAPRRSQQAEETTRPAAQVTGELSGRSGVSDDASLPTGTVMPDPGSPGQPHATPAEGRRHEILPIPDEEHLAQPGLPEPTGPRPVPPTATSTAPEQSAPARQAAEPAPSTEPRPVPVRELPSTEEQRPAAVEAQAPSAGQPPLSQEEQLAERGLAPVYVLPGGDVLAHALTAVAPAESGRLAGYSRPAGPEELRAALANALAADLGLPPGEQRLWSVVAGRTGPSGAPLVTAFGGSADEAVRALRTGSGPEATDWLTLAVAAPVLGLRLTVLTRDGSLWTAGPEAGRPVTLFQQEDPAPYTARWAATEPTARARQARRADLSQPTGTSGYSWGTTSADSSTPPGAATRPAAAASGDSARPVVFFGSEPRPSTPDSQRAGTSSAAAVTRTPPAPVEEASRVSAPVEEASRVSAPAEEASPVSAPAEEASPVSAPVAESALTPPLAEETTTPPRTARDTRDGQDTDAVTILDVPADDGTDVVPTVPREEEPPRTLSPYAMTYGARFDGSLGLAVYEPLSEDVLGALHQQVLDGLGVEPGSAADRAVREELAAVLSQSEIARELPRVRSARGHRVTVTVDGQERTIDVRLRLTDPGLSTRAGVSGEVPRRTTLERHGEGGQSSSRSAGSGTMRTVPIPWIGIYDGPAGPLRWFDGALVLSLTHNQSSESSTVSDGLTARSMQRANDPAHAVQYTSRWQIRIDTDRNAPVDAWSPERAGGPLTVWFPEHRVFGDGGAAGPLPEPAGLDDLPLWGVDEVLDPGRLLDELRADEGFTVLNNLGADSHQELEEFLSERTLRGSLPMMRDGGVHSPVLFDRNGDSLGVLRLEATVLPRSPVAGTPDGKFSLESWLTQSSGVEQSSRLTSGVALDGSGGPMFTPDQAVGHPDAAKLMGGSVMGKAGASWQSGDTLNTGSSVALMHALYTTNTHLVTPADITYRVTLIRSGGGEITGSFGPWPDGVSVRLPQRSTTTGHVPTPEERRQLPEHLENLESIGYSAVPVATEGTGPMFDRAETWLRREGFLPPAERESVVNKTRAEQQLENLRRFAQLRSRLGQAAALPDAVDGGRPLWFDLPDHVSGGARRVQLRFSATRDRTRPAAHTRRLPSVDTVTFSAQEARGGRQRSNMFGGTVGGGGGPRFPVDGGAAALDATGDFTWGRSHDTSASAGSAVGMDGFNITTGAGSELFDIPALFTLDLYEGTAEEPAVRFAAEPTPEPAPGGNPATIQPAEPAPPTAAGHVRLVVPHHRTVPADSLPVVPTAPHQVRAPITGGGQDDDLVRLGLTDDTGRPREGLLRLPDDANVDVFRGSAALQEAFRQIVTGTYPGHPAVGTFGQWAEGATSRLPGAVTGLGSRLWGYLTGPAADDQQAFAGEALYQQLRSASLLGRASQIFNGGYVIEGLTLPGLLADQELSVEIAGYLHHPTYNGSYDTYAESNLSSRDMSATGRSVTTSHQYGGGLGALQSPPPPSSDGTPQRASLANPSVRGVYTHRTGRTSELSAGSTVVRTPTEAGEQHLIGADATLLVTLRQGTRNVAMNVAGLGGHDGITLAIDLPRAIRFQLSHSQLTRFERWFTGVPGMPRPTVAPNTVPLPELYVGTGEVGFGSVLSVTQLDDPIRRNERRDRLRSELLALVEREAPGVTRPGHFAYRMGVATRIADMTSPAELRALPGRRTVSLWFRHAGRHGSRLVEITLSAEPVAQTPARRELRGRPAGAGAGIDQIGAHAPGNRSESETVSRSLRVSANPISRYPRPQGRTGRTDRTGPVLSGTGSRGRISRTDFAAEDRYWARNESVADFDDIDYTITATVRSELVQDWPVDLVGGALESGLLTLTERDGGEPIARILRLLRGRPAHQVRVPAAVSLRFAASESVAPRRHAPAVRPRITHADPRLPAPQAPLPLGGPTFTAGSRLIPTGATPVYGFNAFHEVAEALRTVAPRLSGSWGLTADLTPEAAAFRLGELVQAGEIPVEAPRTAAGLTDTMPGAWPVESEPVTPRLQVTLHNPRPISDADDIAVDRLRVTSRSVGSASSAASTAGLGYQWTQSGNDANMHLVSFTLPVLNRQPVSRAAGASASGGGWDRLKTGAAAASGTEPATRSYETMVDVVITVTGDGTRYVVGSAVARVYERDLLGYGVTAPRTASQVYDLPAMLAGQPNDTLRNWRTHPVTELPAVLARGLDERENGAQLWLHLGADPDGTGLARALYVGSRTAVAAGRPVELVVRGATGLRFWPFGADGSLVDLTPATQDTWNRLRAAIVTATDATAAEADQVARGTELVPREAEAELRLADSRRELTTATEARDAAAAAHATARSARDSLADRLRDAEAARAAAEEEAAPHEAAVTTAEQRLAQTEQAVLDARREVEQEAARLRLLTADGHEPTPQADPGPRAALADARAERDSARAALGRAQDMADVARGAVDRATEKVGELSDRLAAADDQAREASTRERDAEDAVIRAASARDQHHRDHRQLQEELRDARRQQADQQRLWEDAWRAMPGQSGMLSADRCREGVGGARYPLGSLS